MNYLEAKEYRDQNGEIYLQMKTAISVLIKNKNLVFGTVTAEEMNLADSFDLLFEQYIDSSTFILKRKDRLVGLILTDLLEEAIGKAIPAQLVSAFSLIDEYLLLIKQPKPRTTWYLHLDKELIEFVLLKLYFGDKVDLIGMLTNLENEEEREIYRTSGNHLFNYERHFFEVLNELGLDTEEFYNLVIRYSQNEKYNRSAKIAIEEHFKIPERGLALYEYGRENYSHHIALFNTICLVELSKSDLEFAYNEATSLKDISASDCIIPLMFFEYDTTERLMNSYKLVAESDFNKSDKLRFYCKALENNVVSEKQIKLSFNEIINMLDSADLDFSSQVIWWAGMIEGYDIQKEEFLSNVLNLHLPFDPNHFYDKYDDMSFLFNHLKEMYMQYKGSISNFQSLLQQVYNENLQIFEAEVCKLLCSDAIEDAELAIEILESKYHGIYDLDYLHLSEQDQNIAFDRITSTPIIFENLIPSLNNFAKSVYQSVINNFKAKCFEYVDAYGSQFILHTDRFINNEKHAQLIADLKEYNATLEREFELKDAIQEFDPYLNYYRPFNKFLELDHRKMSLLQKRMKSMKENTFGFIKNISIIRGSAFKSENSDKITRLGRFTSLQLLDKRMYEDPIKYEEQYDKVFNAKGK